MVGLRALGVPLAETRGFAVQAAPSVLYEALAGHRDKVLAVDAEPVRAGRFIEALEKETSEGYLHWLADVTADEHNCYGLVHAGSCEFYPVIDEAVITEHVEVAGIINLAAIGNAIAVAAPRALFTLIVPSNFV